jgi:hypothetical protein
MTTSWTLEEFHTALLNDDAFKRISAINIKVFVWSMLWLIPEYVHWCCVLLSDTVVLICCIGHRLFMMIKLKGSGRRNKRRLRSASGWVKKFLTFCIQSRYCSLLWACSFILCHRYLHCTVLLWSIVCHCFLNIEIEKTRRAIMFDWGITS